jgi:hypothetical protein
MSELLANIDICDPQYQQGHRHRPHRYQAVTVPARPAGPFSPSLLDQLLVYSYVFS